jgi:hypothetical protein
MNGLTVVRQHEEMSLESPPRKLADVTEYVLDHYHVTEFTVMKKLDEHYPILTFQFALRLDDLQKMVQEFFPGMPGDTIKVFVNEYGTISVCIDER